MIAIVTLSDAGARIGGRLLAKLPEGRLYVHEEARSEAACERFSRVADLTAAIFSQAKGIVYILPCGVAVRAIAPLAKHKLSDPAIVAVDAGGRFAVSLLSGHEGGANQLAIDVANIIGAEPVISTTTDALKSVIVGVGCRKGAEAGAIVAAVRKGLAEAQADLSEVRLLASADIKSDEAGLIEAAKELELPLRFIASDELRACQKDFTASEFVEEKVGLPAVAEPAALLAGRRTRLILPRHVWNSVTVAIAKEELP